MEGNDRALLLEAKLILETGTVVDFSEVDDLIDRLRGAYDDPPEIPPDDVGDTQ